MRPLLRSILFFVFAAASLHAQSTRDLAIDLRADVSASVPRITLSWTQRQQASISSQQIFRRLKGDVNWGTALATLTTTATSYADSTALAGVEYEYWMQRSTSFYPSPSMGYISAGVNLPMVESRGKLLLVIDNTMVAPLAPEITQLRADLASDGWTVQTITATRTDTAINTKALIKAAYDADPANVKQVYVLGHVPVPYSGNQGPDGHSGHVGAWPADGFYGDMDGTWTDTTVNNSSAADSRNRNVPGDGKLDQNTIPSTLELIVGRVDLANMQRAPSSGVSETSLLRRYLRKAHDFKFKQGAYASIQRRVLIRDGFGYFGGETFMTTGWSWAFTSVGRPPEVTIDEPASNAWWAPAAANTYLMANGNGGGTFESCSSVGSTADFGRRPFKAVFVSLFGSYFGDWDITNNFMRAPLAGNATGDGLGLCSFWAGRPAWFMHHMAMGETLGYLIRQSINSQSSSISNPVYTPVNYPGGGTHCGLMGDPTLRMHIAEPPRNLVATSASGTVNLTWTASTETALLGYHVYRGATSAGPFTRLTASPLGTTSYADATGTPATAYTYMVRTLKLETSPGGTYQNLSEGSQAAITVNAGATGVPLNPTNLAVVQSSAVNAQLTWNDNAADETGYRIERKVNGTGSYATLITLAAGVTAYTDAGPFTQGNVYYYRVIATGATGDSIASNEVSFDAVTGFFEFNDTFVKMSKTVGTAVIPVKRFGGVTGPASVAYATSDSSAIAGTHYTTATGTLNWADGETGSKSISVPITNSGTAQQPRQFRITLSTPSAGTSLGVYNAIAVLIEDPTATLPAPWNQSIVGGVITSSSTAVNAEGGLCSTTIGGYGLTSAGTAEGGQFIYQSHTGDGVMTALVPAAFPAQTNSRFAIMVRENATSNGAPMAGTSTSSDATFGSKFIYRSTSFGFATYTGSALTSVTPRWLRLTRAGNLFTSECSADGITWTNLGNATVPLSSTAQWGMFHHSDDLSITTLSGNYQTVSFQNVTVNTPATVTLASLAQTYDGSPKSVTSTTAPPSLTVTYTYNDSSTAPTNVGSYSVVATVTSVGYVGTAGGTLVISKATPTVITPPTASAIITGQTLASSTLSGGAASVPGTFTFTTPSTAPALGTASQAVTFNPTDTANYNTANTTASVTVFATALAAWAGGYGLSGANAAADADPDRDGIANLFEWILSSSPLASSTASLPQASSDANTLSLTFARNDATESSTTLIGQWCADFVTWHDVPIGTVSSGPDANGVSVTITENTSAPDTIVFIVPRTNGALGRLFVRLKASLP